MNRDRLLTLQPPAPSVKFAAAVVTVAPALVSDALGNADADGVISASHDIVAGATLTCRYFCSVLSAWLLAEKSAAETARTCEQYATVQWLVPKFSPVHVFSDTSGNVAVGGLIRT